MRKELLPVEFVALLLASAVDVSVPSTRRVAVALQPDALVGLPEPSQYEEVHP